MIVLAVIIPIAGLILLLGMARLEARFLRPDGRPDRLTVRTDIALRKPTR